MAIDLLAWATDYETDYAYLETIPPDMYLPPDMEASIRDVLLDDDSEEYILYIYQKYIAVVFPAMGWGGICFDGEETTRWSDCCYELSDLLEEFSDERIA